MTAGCVCMAHRLRLECALERVWVFGCEWGGGWEGQAVCCVLLQLLVLVQALQLCVAVDELLLQLALLGVGWGGVARVLELLMLGVVVVLALG